MRRPAQLRRPATALAPTPRPEKAITFPAPVGGWISNRSLATPGARLPDGSKVNGAYLLENWFPTSTGVRMRAGSDIFATLGLGDKDVVSMFAYVNGNNRKFFASTADALYDITSPASPTNQVLVDDLGNTIVDDLGNEIIGLVSVPVAVSPLAGGNWVSEQFATAGGIFLRCVNGADTPLVFDGTSWSTSPAITGTGLDPTALSYVWSSHRRLYFVERDSLNAWYLPADAIGGVATKIPLGGVFSRGGSLLFGSSWSLETGGADGAGLSVQTVFVTTEGEVAVYQGTDPASTSTWSLVGVYRIGKPRGAKAHIRAGGDLVIATDIGFLPLSTAVQRDFAALAPAAISYPIEEAWKEAVRLRSSGGWACALWPTRQMVMVAPPTPAGSLGELFPANARTGAWGHYTNWNVTCLQLFGDRMFFGSTKGLIVEAEVTGFDQGLPYTAACVPLFDSLKAPLSLKTSLLMKATLKAPAEVIPQMSLQADFVVSLPSSPDAAAVAGGSLWGTAIWGQSVWGAQTTLNVYGRWQSVGGAGYAIAPATQITSGNLAPPNVELVRVDMTYDQGEIVT